MTTDKLLSAIKAWIELKAGASLVGVSVYLGDTEQEKEPPMITLKETGNEEHPVLRGVMTIDLEAILETVPGAADQEADTQAMHEAKANELYEILADIQIIQFCDAYPGLKVFDIRGFAPTNESDDQNRLTRFEMRAVACKR
jgi:hypothetical protein